MDLSGERLLVTGGAGFVGSHLIERLVAENEVVVADDLRNARREWVPDGAELVEGDLADPEFVADVVAPDLDGVFHLAADKAAERDEVAQFRRNSRLTENLVERMDEAGVTDLAFTSSATVYGEAPMPTPEDYAGEPISVYGASKAASEALCSVYAHSHGFSVQVFRFANIVGPRLQPGAVIVDFVEKLREDPEILTILGDGRQEKSYMHVSDCVEAMCRVVEDAGGPMAVYNLGTNTTTSVVEIADIVAAEMGLDPDYEFTGGERGWVGDVPRMRLSIERLTELGFEPELESTEAVRRATRELVEERLH